MITWFIGVLYTLMGMGASLRADTLLVSMNMPKNSSNSGLKIKNTMVLSVLMVLLFIVC